MTIKNHVSLLLYRRHVHGSKSTLDQLANHIFTTTTTTLAGFSAATTLIVFSYATYFDKRREAKIRRRPIEHLSSANSSFHRWYSCCHLRSNQTRCDPETNNTTTTSTTGINLHYAEAYDPDLDLDSSGYTEEERFYQCVSYHRSLLHDYNRRWGNRKGQALPDRELHQTTLSNQNNFESKQSNESTGNLHHNDIRSGWPRNTPNHREVTALEHDLVYCQRSPEYQNDKTVCQSTKFRIASYYISVRNNCSNNCQRDKGFRVVKELAEQGYPDAMCSYGILLNEGTIDGVEANPQHAVVWWRRCVDEHGHINSIYELANACYLGDGIVENSPMAVSLFRRAAHLGHAGAAYMLGECLLNGVGVERDRTDALEWLVTSAELGHRGAQDRVLMILNVDYGNYNAASDRAKQRQLEETIKWIDYDEDIESYDPKLEPLHKAVSIERRFTIGGGSRNPVVVARRKSIVAESRND